MLDKCGFWAGELSRGLILVLVVFASFAYGLTRQGGIDFFNVALGSTVGLWLVSCLLSRRWPATGIWPWLIVAGILALGWTVTGLGIASNAYVDDDYQLSDPIADLALEYGTFDVPLSVAAMIRTSALLGGFLLLIDLFSRPGWARALVLTVATTGLAMVIFFFLQKVIGGPFVLRSLEPGVTLSFATFRYHGNAASYLNLIWPVLGALFVHLLRNQARGWMLWMAAALFAFGAIFINISKAGQLLAPIGFVLFLGFLVVQMLRRGRRHITLPSPAILIATSVPVVVIAISLYLAIPWDRWQALQETELDRNARTVAYEYFLKMLPDAGWLGFGPGTFQLAYWNYVDRSDPIMQHTPYWVAHEDYIQTIVEWGYAGTILWGLLLVLPTARLIFCGLRPPHRETSGDDSYHFSLLDHLRAFFRATPGPDDPILQAAAAVSIVLTALHSTVDFPMQIESLQFYFLIWIALGWQLLRRRRTAAIDRPT